ncbi:MAG: hypothetical protein ABJA64_01810 [Candidatus Saccharibacteria bacterium]
MPTKQKSVKRNRVSRGRSLRPNTVEIIPKGSSKLRHFRIVHHRHTGKLLHHRHTSHLALVCILAIVGLFIYVSQDITSAATQTVNHDVTVNAVVPGAAPTVGATITSPVNGATFEDTTTIQVSGTCAATTFVVVSSNSSVVGSTMCTIAGIFVLQIQPFLGQNVLSALNYDGINQPGPVTPTVTITVTRTSTPEHPAQAEPAIPALPANPSVIPGLGLLSPLCQDYAPPNLPTGGSPRVSVVCIPRTINPNTQYMLGVLTWGGSSPYALDISWGDTTDNTLLSLPAGSYKTIPFQYDNPGTYVITIKLKDKDGSAAFVQTTVLVNGETKPFFTGLRDTILHIGWFETPVPLYLMAVALTLGFWGGDIFDRRFGVTKHYRKKRRTA